MQPLPPPVPGPLALLDTTEGFARRKKTSLWFVGSLLVVSISILTVGLAATTRTENVTMGGYYPGIILGFGSFLGIIGINLVENRKQMEPRPLTAGRCQFYSSGVGYLPDVYQTEVTCHSLNGRCQLKVKSNTCYCCDLYDCQRSRCPSWPTARPQRLRSSTTPPSRSWPTRASARCPRLSPPARRTRCPSRSHPSWLQFPGRSNRGGASCRAPEAGQSH